MTSIKVWRLYISSSCFFKLTCYNLKKTDWLANTLIYTIYVFPTITFTIYWIQNTFVISVGFNWDSLMSMTVLWTLLESPVSGRQWNAPALSFLSSSDWSRAITWLGYWPLVGHSDMGMFPGIDDTIACQLVFDGLKNYNQILQKENFLISLLSRKL